MLAAARREGLHDFVHARLEFRDGERLFKKRQGAGILTHGLIILNAAPVRTLVTFEPSRLRCNVEEMKPGARRTNSTVVRASRSRSCCWLVGSTVKTLINVITLLSPL